MEYTSPVMKSKRPALKGLILFAAFLLLTSSQASGELPRRIGASLLARYYILDSDYFGMDDAFGMDISLIYELTWNIYFENRIGLFESESNNVSVYGMTYNMGLLAIFPVIIPYRPLARFGIGFMAADPLTVDPTKTFRPTQTTFYFYGGTGVTRTIKENIIVETNTNVWFTPYEYRIYSFYRNKVEVEKAQFTHVTFSLGISYIF